MSHFTVAVITKENNIKEIDKILEPYWEEIEVEPYIDEYGNETTYNPKSKWDWYDIGGRWRNQLLVKDDNKDTLGHNSFDEYIGNFIDTRESETGYKFVNGAMIKDICFDKMEKINKGKFYTWALVDENDWYEQGQMGWWAISDATEETSKKFEEFFEEYISKEENKNKYLTIVDCHI